MKVFCAECRGEHEYRVEESVDKYEVRGDTVEYVEKLAYCTNCGEEVWVNDIVDENLERLDAAYREKKDLITIDEINEILKKYNVGKRPLSKLLGWGEVTLTRFVDGDIPSVQYSEQLKKILNDSDYMLEIAEKNKGNISDVAYGKIVNAIRSGEAGKLSFDGRNKIDSIVKYLLVKSEDITPLALQKLLYYCQGVGKVFTGKFLFDEDCEAWAHGPVYKEMYHRYKEYGYKPINSKISDIEDKELSEVEKEIIDTVIHNFGCYSGKILEKMTHAESPWIIAREGMDDDEKSNQIIPKESINEYFIQVKEKYKMLSVADIKTYSKDLFDKVCC